MSHSIIIDNDLKKNRYFFSKSKCEMKQHTEQTSNWKKMTKRVVIMQTSTSTTC